MSVHCKALVLCAGFGTRLHELTRERPKPLLPLAGEPLLAHTLRHLARCGVHEVAINLHYRGDMIRSAIGDGSRYGAHVHYAQEPKLLGTAGAIRNLDAYFADADHVLVVYGDLLFDEDLSKMLAFHLARDAAATLLVHRRPGSNSRVQLDAEQRICGFLERPPADTPKDPDCYVNSGIQWLTQRAIQRIPTDREADLPRDLYARWHTTDRYYGYPLRGFRCAIDSAERYALACEAVASGRLRG